MFASSGEQRGGHKRTWGADGEGVTLSCEWRKTTKPEESYKQIMVKYYTTIFGISCMYLVYGFLLTWHHLCSSDCCSDQICILWRCVPFEAENWSVNDTQMLLWGNVQSLIISFSNWTVILKKTTTKTFVLFSLIIKLRNRKLDFTLITCLWLFWELAVGSVSRESSGCSVRVRIWGGAFISRRSNGGTDWIRSKSLGRENWGSPTSPGEDL